MSIRDGIPSTHPAGGRESGRRLSEHGRRLRQESRELIDAARAAVARAKRALVRSKHVKASTAARVQEARHVIVKPSIAPRV